MYYKQCERGAERAREREGRGTKRWATACHGVLIDADREIRISGASGLPIYTHSDNPLPEPSRSILRNRETLDGYSTLSLSLSLSFALSLSLFLSSRSRSSGTIHHAKPREARREREIIISLSLALFAVPIRLRACAHACTGYRGWARRHYQHISRSLSLSLSSSLSTYRYRFSLGRSDTCTWPKISRRADC